MRIQKKRQTGNSTAPVIKTGHKRIEATSKREFPDLLQHYEQDDGKEKLEALIRSLDEIGQRLVKSFSLYDFKTYKDVLKNFLRQTSGQNYQLKEETGHTRLGKTKIYQTIHMINAELEELSKLILAKQKDQLQILMKLDQIRGLLVDLYS